MCSPEGERVCVCMNRSCTFPMLFVSLKSKIVLQESSPDFCRYFVTLPLEICLIGVELASSGRCVIVMCSMQSHLHNKMTFAACGNWPALCPCPTCSKLMVIVLNSVINEPLKSRH